MNLVELQARPRIFQPISRSPGKSHHTKFAVVVARAGRSDDWFCTENEGNSKPSDSFSTCRRDLYVELSARCYDYGRGGKVE